MPTPDYAAFEAMMRAERLPELVIRTFRHALEQLASGETGLIPEADLLPARDLPRAEELGASAEAAGRAALPQALQIKLNGGLGTSMGLEQAKSLLKVRGELTFLDIIARQSLASGVPLVLMDSFSTQEDTLAFLAAGYPTLGQGPLPLDFCQHKVPKVGQAGLAPLPWPDDPELAWCPPGHGDLYTALVTSGALDAFLAAGYRYAFVSNADNLGATLDPALLGFMVERGLPFVMEVTARTPADRKGGHLAVRRSDGQLLLRESAQCPPEDLESFQDITRHTAFNTNNIWLDLHALRARLDACDGVLGLPLIRNAKTLDPRDPQSPPVYQLETAMGAAIGVFPGAAAILVPRTRFAPVKTTGDLLAVRSDAYVLTDDHRVVPAPDRRYPDLTVDLDPAYYRRIDDLEARFPQGPPSLWRARSLKVRGDVTFGARIIIENDAVIEPFRLPGPVTIADGCSFDGGPWRV